MDWNWIETVARHQRTMRADAAPSNLDAATPAGSKTTSRSAQWNYIYAAASAKENWFIDAAAPLPCEDSHYKFRWQHQGNLVQSFQSNLETRMTKDNGTAHSAISLKHLKFNFKYCCRLRAPPLNNFSLLNNWPFFCTPPHHVFWIFIFYWFQFTFNWKQFTFNWFQFTFNWNQLIFNWNQLIFNWF